MAKKAASKDKETIYVGMDLGTSRSAIAVSNGERHMVESFVGWPLDMVAKKVLKRDVLVGREARENRSMLDLRRPLERGILREGSNRDQEAVRELASHLLVIAGVAQAQRDGNAVHAVIGVPAEAMRVSRRNLLQALDGLVDRIILVSEPFAVAYGLGALLHSLVIDIGAGTTDFCVMMGRYPTEEDQRTLPTAGDWVDDRLYRAVRERFPDSSFNIHMVQKWKEAYSFVGNRKTPVKVTVPVHGKPTEIDITTQMRNSCEALTPHLAESMLDLVASVEPEYQRAVRNNVILAGGGCSIKGLAAALQDALEEIGGGKVTSVNEPLFCGAEGGLALAQDAPASDWEKLAP